MAKGKVLAPLLAAEAMEDQFDIGGSQRRFAYTLCAIVLLSSVKERIAMQEQDSDQNDHERSSLPLSSSRPGKGRLILLLGLLSLLGYPLLLSCWFLVSTLFGKSFFLSQFFGLAAIIGWPFTFVLGIITILMAYRELSRINKGITEPSNRKSTAAGMWLGSFGSILTLLGGAVFLSMMSGVGTITDNKDAIINDLNWLFTNAYQYRVRSAPTGGGGGGYTGYFIPDTLTSYEGEYTVNVLHADTVTFHAQSNLEDSSSITVKIGPDGQPIANSWIYTGKFE